MRTRLNNVPQFDKRYCVYYIPRMEARGIRETMQRVRIGLTGLALVFLLVLLGEVVRSVSDDSVPANIAGQASNPDAAANGQEPTEPLGQLGVAPGNADSDNAAAAPPAPFKQ